MPDTGPHTLAFDIRGPIARDDLPGLCDRVCALLGGNGVDLAYCEVRGVEPDAVTVDALARLQLAARRHGCQVRLRHASDELLELVAFMGLGDVLPDQRVPRDIVRTLVADYTIKNLRDVEDMALKAGFSESQEARFPRQELELETRGLSHQIVRPGKRHAFGHRHNEAEEVYVVLGGSGRCRLDDEVVEVGRLDTIRVGPSVARAFEAGSEGLELLVFSRYAPGDAELIPDFWTD